jgi:hypothetical protein
MLVWGRVDKTLLEAEFLRDVCELLDKSPFTYKVTEGYRSLERSNKLYDEYLHGVVLYEADGTTPQRNANGTVKRGKLGAKAAPGGKSAHNFGLAIDVVVIGADGKADWTGKTAAWLWLWAKCKAHPRLKSGATFGDGPHIEKHDWKDYVGWRKMYEDNQRAIKAPHLYLGVGIPT